MVRIFDEVDIAHVEGNVDPIRDIEIIHDELRLKDLELARKIGDDSEKKVVRGNDKTLKADYVRSSFPLSSLIYPSLNERKRSIKSYKSYPKRKVVFVFMIGMKKKWKF